MVPRASLKHALPAPPPLVPRAPKRSRSQDELKDLPGQGYGHRATALAWFNPSPGLPVSLTRDKLCAYVQGLYSRSSAELMSAIHAIFVMLLFIVVHARREARVDSCPGTLARFHFSGLLLRQCLHAPSAGTVQCQCLRGIYEKAPHGSAIVVYCATLLWPHQTLCAKIKPPVEKAVTSCKIDG